MTTEIKYWLNGNKYFERYFVNGKLHKLDGPAYIVYNENGTIWYEKYYVNDIYHREDGPAFILYHITGNISIEKYYVNDKLHRLDGPAWVDYESGKIAFQAYFVNGYQIPQKEINEILEQCDNDKQLLKDILTIRNM